MKIDIATLALLFLFAAGNTQAAPPPPLKTFTIDDTLYACWQDRAASVKYDSPAELAFGFLEQHEWNDSSVQTEPWTPCDEARCYEEDLAEVAKACPVKYVVAGNAFGSDQPLFACDAKCLTDRKKGKEIGRTGKELVAPCEGPLSPVWSAGSNVQWQFTTFKGKRGLAKCQPELE